MDEVEDIMCDQCILSSELAVQFDNRKSYLIIPATKLWIALDLLTRTLLPSMTSIYYTLFKNPHNVVDSFRHQIFPALVAFLANSISRSLASVQKISFPVTIRIIKENQSAILNEEELIPERSVECDVLTEPQEIHADVIFVHGLHGGIDKTWKQGRWRQDWHKLKHQTPVQCQFTGKLYVPPRQQSLKRTISGIYSTLPKKVAKREKGDCVVAQLDECDSEELITENENYSQCWPKDWIPKDCPNVRVIALNYSTDVLWCPMWSRKRKRTNMVARSQEMIEELIKIGVGKNPIIWVGHSKGGLFIKQIIVNAWENNQHRPEVLDIFRQTKSIMWYSVPHKGSALADFSVPLLRRSIELLEIQRNCSFVLDLHKNFLRIIRETNLNPEVFSFIETSFTLMSFIYLKIVSYDSADPNIGIKCDVPLDHREICKPAGRDCFLYIELIKLIKRCLDLHK